MSKFIYIILLIIEYIKNFENIEIKPYNYSNDTIDMNPLIIELDKTIDLYHIGKDLNISNILFIGFSSQKSIYFYYDFEPYPPPKFTTFTIFFRQTSKSYTNTSNIFSINVIDVFVVYLIII